MIDKTIVFTKNSDPFQSAGLATLIERLERINPPDTAWRMENQTLTIRSANLEAVLNDIFEQVGVDFYDTSTKKQRDAREGIYFDTKLNQPVRYPKVKQVGFPQMINDSRPLGESIKFGSLKPEMKSIIRDFAADNGLKIADKDPIYMDNRNSTIPYPGPMCLEPGSKKCMICGRGNKETYQAVKLSPFLGGSSAGLNFVSETKKPEEVCWSCQFLNRLSVGKFIYDNRPQGTKKQDLYAFFFNVDDLEGLIKVNNKLLTGGFLYTPEQRFAVNYNRNFDYFFEGKRLISTQHFHENLLALIYTLYLKMLTIKNDNPDLDDFLSLENTLKYNTNLFYLRAKKFGNTLRPQDSGEYTEMDYLFRLFDAMQSPENGRIDMFYLYNDTVDYSQLAKGGRRYDIAVSTRNEFARNVLYKRPIVGIMEELMCRTGNHCTRSMVNFAKLYESYIRYGGNMAMNDNIRDNALKLGSQIGMSILGASGRINSKIGKAKLIQLRKARNLEAFMDTLISIQNRYDLTISKDLLQSINEDNFNYVRQFCIVQSTNIINSNAKASKMEESNE